MPAYHFIEDIFKPWMAETKGDKKIGTLRNEASCEKRLKAYFGDCYVSSSKSKRFKIIDGAMVGAFRESELLRGLSDRSAGEIIVKASAACNYAIREKNYDMPNPFAGRAMSRAGRKRASKSRRDVTDRGLWSKEDEERFCAHAPEFVADVTRFALLTGCRLGEILALVDEDVYSGEWYRRIEGNEIIFSPQDQKSNFWGSCFMNDKALEILNRQKSTVIDGKNYRFSWGGKALSTFNFNYYFKRARRKAGLPDLVFRNTRKTCGQRMLDAGADLEGVQAQLRHESIQTTESWYVRPAMSRAQQAAALLVDK